VERNAPARARALRELIVAQGPAFVKVGQAVAIRPDLLPQAYLDEFATLLDQVSPFNRERGRQDAVYGAGGERGNANTSTAASPSGVHTASSILLLRPSYNHVTLHHTRVPPIRCVLRCQALSNLSTARSAPSGGLFGSACPRTQLGIPETAHRPTLESHQLPHGSTQSLTARVPHGSTQSLTARVPHSTMQVAPFSSEEARAMVEAETGRPLAELFDDVSAFDAPVAAASIGQVYKVSDAG
jgi:hypothetical protein